MGCSTYSWCLLSQIIKSLVKARGWELIPQGLSVRVFAMLVRIDHDNSPLVLDITNVFSVEPPLVYDINSLIRVDFAVRNIRHKELHLDGDVERLPVRQQDSLRHGHHGES